MQENLFACVSQQAIEIQSAFDFIAHPAHGGSTIFQGTIRNLNVGRQVIAVSYDVHELLAINSFKTLYQKAIEQWGDSLKIYINHFKGRLDVGGISVLIGVSSRHRDEAFKACRFIIEEIKHTSPIWKQEHYADGDSEWVQGHALCQQEKML